MPSFYKMPNGIDRIATSKKVCISSRRQVIIEIRLFRREKELVIPDSAEDIVIEMYRIGRGATL